MFKEKNIHVFMKEVVSPSHIDHFYSPIYNKIFGIKNNLWRYAENLNNFESVILIPYLERGIFIKKLRVHSHGNKNPPGFYDEVGPVIRMGEDNLSLYDFYQNGNPYPGLVRDFLITLKKTLVENAEITFDSCNQGKGNLLKNISNFLERDIIVNGFSGLGAPFIKSNLGFCNGKRVY